MGLPKQDIVPKLTGQQHQFCQLFLTQARGDAVQAVRLMGLTDDEAAIKKLAKRYLNLAAVRWHIDRWASQHMAPAEILARLSAIARGDQVDFWKIDEDTGRPLHLDLRKAQALGLTSLIRKLKLGKDGAMELELYSAHEAMRDMMKVHQMHKSESNVHHVIEHVVRGMDDATRAEVMAALGGLVAGGGALPPHEEAPGSDVIDAEVGPVSPSGWEPEPSEVPGG